MMAVVLGAESASGAPAAQLDAVASVMNQDAKVVYTSEMSTTDRGAAGKLFIKNYDVGPKELGLHLRMLVILVRGNQRAVMTMLFSNEATMKKYGAGMQSLLKSLEIGTLPAASAPKASTVAAIRRQRRLDRRLAGVRDRSWRQPLVGVRVVRIVRVVELRAVQPIAAHRLGRARLETRLVPRDARGRLLHRHHAAVADRRIGLQLYAQQRRRWPGCSRRRPATTCVSARPRRTGCWPCSCMGTCSGRPGASCGCARSSSSCTPRSGRARSICGSRRPRPPRCSARRGAAPRGRDDDRLMRFDAVRVHDGTGQRVPAHDALRVFPQALSTPGVGPSTRCSRSTNRRATPGRPPALCPSFGHMIDERPAGGRRVTRHAPKPSRSLEHARDHSEHGFGYPRFVEREFEKFLACGLLCTGFVRVRCDHCNHNPRRDHPPNRHRNSTVDGTSPSRRSVQPAEVTSVRAKSSPMYSSGRRAIRDVA